MTLSRQGEHKTILPTSILLVTRLLLQSSVEVQCNLSGSTREYALTICSCEVCLGKEGAKRPFQDKRATSTLKGPVGKLHLKNFDPEESLFRPVKRERDRERCRNDLPSIDLTCGKTGRAAGAEALAWLPPSSICLPYLSFPLFAPGKFISKVN